MDANAIHEIKSKIRNMRGAAIAKGGEFSFENLVFKELRNRGYLDKMSNYLREWKKFLTEDQEIKLDPNQMGIIEFRDKFAELCSQSKSFVELFLNAVIRLELRPFIRSLSEDDRKAIFRTAKQTFGYNYELKDKLDPNSAIKLSALDTYDFHDLLAYYVNYFTDKPKADEFVNKRPGFKISLLYLDMDIEKPTYDTLVNFWDRISKGGIVVLDEYAHHQWSESIGVDKFLDERKIGRAHV